MKQFVRTLQANTDFLPESHPEIGSPKPAILHNWILACLLILFLVLETFIPLRTAVQIGADEGFELAKATLCLDGHRLYSEVWNDQPPLHTFLITQTLRHLGSSVLFPRLLTVGFTLLLLAGFFQIARRVSGVPVAALATAFIIASHGFLELSSSCMLELPSLALALVALCLLVTYEEPHGWVMQAASGAIFGLSLQIKLVPLIYTALVVFILYLRHAGAPGSSKKLLVSLAVFGISLGCAYVISDLLIDRGAYLINFQHVWASHFGPPRSAEYGTASDHPFAWGTLIKNWDVTVPAMASVIASLGGFRRVSISMLPFLWLALTFVVFGLHKPWWPYYYIHTTVPLCWCAGLGLMEFWKRFKGERLLVSLIGLFGLCAALWMGARVYLQISNLRHSPQIYSSPVIAQMKRFKPLAHWIYADQLVYSFYSQIPMIPSLAVVPAKRMWSGEMTNSRLTEELIKYKPELVVLLNDGRELPFQGFLEQEYQIVYMDRDNRLYALRSIAKRHTRQPVQVPEEMPSRTHSQ